MAFQGRHHLKMDQKGRFRLPSSLVSDGPMTEFVLTNSLYKGEKCLDLYTLDVWTSVQERAAELPVFDTHVQAFQRFYISSAQKVEKDGQDRILIPTGLREFANLDSEIVAIGMGHKLELWNLFAWDKIFSDISMNYDEILKTVSQFQNKGEKK